MSQQCPKCQTGNPDGARFCQNCGVTLAATVVQGRTVVAQMVPGPGAAAGRHSATATSI